MPAPSLQFGQAAYAVDESSSTVQATIYVTRAGDSTPAIGVTYATLRLPLLAALQGPRLGSVRWPDDAADIHDADGGIREMLIQPSRGHKEAVPPGGRGHALAPEEPLGKKAALPRSLFNPVPASGGIISPECVDAQGGKSGGDHTKQGGYRRRCGLRRW
jgi:hypothetical protein